MTLSTRTCVFSLGCVLLCTPACAQSAAGQLLAAAKAIRCEFQAMSTGNWKSAMALGTVTPTVTRIAFTAINVDEGTAESSGQFGRTDIIAKLSSENLHLIQTFKEGPVYMTTVFNSENRPGRLKAVHTRHEFTEVSIPGYTSRPEQYYGDCLVER